MVVDDQDSDTNHETPFPRLRVEQGIPKVRKAPDRPVRKYPEKGPENDDRRGYDTRGRGCAPHGRRRCGDCYPHRGRRTRLSRPLSGTGPHRCCSTEYGYEHAAEGDLQNWPSGAFMVCRMFRSEAEVDKDRRDLLRSRLRDTNTAAPPVLAARHLSVVGTIPEHPPGITEFLLTKQLARLNSPWRRQGCAPHLHGPGEGGPRITCSRLVPRGRPWCERGAVRSADDAGPARDTRVRGRGAGCGGVSGGGGRLGTGSLRRRGGP
ncbi:hypothetical protein GCM10017687_35700 [Streptomyces echinatus]